MKNSVKTLVLITISVLLFNDADAQLKFNPGSSINNDIRKVIEDYPNRFSNLLGDVIVQNPQSTDYECNFKVSGATACTITRYTTKKDDICSWQAVMLTTENFQEAKKKYHSLYLQINNLAVKPGETKTYRLKGTYDNPAEEKNFAGSVYSLAPADEAVKKLKVEISMQYEMMEWKVKLLVYDREREDSESGKTVEREKDLINESGKNH